MRDYSEEANKREAERLFGKERNARCIVPDVRPQYGERPGYSHEVRRYYEAQCNCEQCRKSKSG